MIIIQCYNGKGRLHAKTGGGYHKVIEILIKNQKEVVKIKRKKKTVTEMKNTFDGLISRLSHSKE